MNSSSFLLLNLNSKPSREIFEECGFDIDIIGMDRVCSAESNLLKAEIELLKSFAERGLKEKN
jgi:hypothetical protein